jgi:hypothetical protein
MRDKKSSFNTSKAYLSTNIIDIMDKPDVAVWNKTVRTEGTNKVRLNFGPLDQDLIREDKNIMIDTAEKQDVADTIISGTRATDQVDLSKLNRKDKENHLVGVNS